MPRATCSPLPRAVRTLGLPLLGLGALGLTLALASNRARAEDEPAPNNVLPEKLRAWAGPSYPNRYVLHVEGPPAAGTIQLQSQPELATLYVPLKLYPPEPNGDGSPRIEPILLLSETGDVQPVFVRPVKGGNEVEVAFPSRPGMRRFCLYFGSEGGIANERSPVTFQPKAVRVQVHGQYANPEFIPTLEKPTDLKKFQALPRHEGHISQTVVEDIDDPEPPFPGRGGPRQNDPRYVALYEGFVRTQNVGEYEFALATQGAAFLQVDGADVLSAGAPDAARAPFALHGKLKLESGVHRIVIYYAQAGAIPGLRLFWKTPGDTDFLTIPPQCFLRALPGVLTALEDKTLAAKPFIHFEDAGQYRTGYHRGPKSAVEYARFWVQGGGPGATSLKLTPEGGAPVELPLSGGFAWLPAGTNLEATLTGAVGASATRKIRWPTEAEGARSVQDLTGELYVKSVPTFLYPDETGQIHLETLLSPVPVIIPKERIEGGPPLPPHRPFGEYRVTAGVVKDGAFTEWQTVEATPDASGPKKIRVPVKAGDLEALSKAGTARVEVRLSIGGVPADALRMRVLHSREAWPGQIQALPDGLAWLEKNAAASTAGIAAAAFERPLLIVPRENDADYRRFHPPGIDALTAPRAAAALFLGDPLCEAPADAPADKALGLSAKLAANVKVDWINCVLPGPQRGWFVFRLLAAAEALIEKRGAAGLPPLVVISLGTGDAARQTPQFEFVRGLDVLVDRLRRAGARRIEFVGVLPEPERLKQAQGYQDHLNELMREHHLDALDILALWTKDADWQKRYSLDPEGKSPVYGPYPNAASLDELAKALADRIK